VMCWLCAGFLPSHHPALSGSLSARFVSFCLPFANIERLSQQPTTMQLKAVTLACLCACAASSKIIGDAVPPPLPVVSVHVPEPAIGSVEQSLAALDKVAQEQAIAEASAKQSKLSSAISAGFEALNTKLAALASQQRAASFVQLRDPMSTMTDLIADTPVSSAPDMTAINGASDIVKGIASVEAPAKAPAALDPRPIIYGSCDRDTSGCPLGWENVGAIYDGATSYCAAGSSYFGPCISEAASFDGKSDAAKARWSASCQAVWPCVVCERDFGAACPAGWSASGTSCSPPSSYSGPCGASDFAGYNKAMREMWSSQCGAFWACA